MAYKDPERNRAREKAWRKANPERKRALNRAWRKANPEKARWHWATRRDKAANREYQKECPPCINFAAMHGKPCPVMPRIILDMHAPMGASNAMEIDRKDSNKGYVDGNVRIISAYANRLKNNASLSDLQDLLTDAMRLRMTRGLK